MLLGQSGLQRVCYGVRTWPGVLKAAESLQDAGSATAAIDALSHEMKLACVVALTARWLRPFNVGDEEVMMAAMSQRLGRLLVLYHYPEESAQITRLMQPGPPEPEGKPTPGMSYEAAVGAVLGINPDELTSAVLKHWGLGDSIIQATKPYGTSMPHRPESPDEWLRLIANLSNELGLGRCVRAAAATPADPDPHAVCQAFSDHTKRTAGCIAPRIGIGGCPLVGQDVSDPSHRLKLRAMPDVVFECCPLFLRFGCNTYIVKKSRCGP